jgi:hypothetical protein
MSKIWAIALCDISDLRESQLSSILNSEETSLKFDYLWSNQNRLDKELLFKTKVYKTLSGANRSSEALTKRYQGESIRIKPYHDGRKWIKEISFDKSKHKFIPIEITQKWNEQIDNLITQKNKEHDNEIKNLLRRKV